MEERELGGLRCGQVLAHLSEYLDGELPAELKAAADAHLAACPNCRAFGGQMEGLLGALRTAPPPPVPPGLLDRLQQRLASED
ncbi:MAG: zf-HC2 domain-containing protein [Myxococcota bacterium]|nr:zf-HC2 domain-containing protein [Myxococcota bacterium]